MTWTYGEKTLTQNIESATLTPYIGETLGEPETIELPYEFPADSTQSYILTYTTSLPEVQMRVRTCPSLIRRGWVTERLCTPSMALCRGKPAL